MAHPVVAGLAAGAAGTAALNVVTYLDMARRGRPASDLPAQSAGRLVDQVHLPLGEGSASENRREGLGALLGYLTGIGVGVAYGLVRSRVRLPLPAAAVGLAAAAMTGSDVALTVSGLTDPRQWPLSGWVADVVPHLAYGAATAGVYQLAAGSGPTAWTAGRVGRTAS
jgi:hypothetical protein